MSGHPEIALPTFNNGLVSMDPAWDLQTIHQGVYEKELAMQTNTTS